MDSFGNIDAIYSPTKKAAMGNIFPFCMGMLATYYVTAAIKDDNGSEMQTVSVLTLYVAYGSQYNYLLTYENGVYKISGKSES